jgi:hypothetical protein
MDIRILKLVTGEEVIGEVIHDGGKFTIKNPVLVAMMRGKDGMPNVGFAPFPAYAEDSKDKTIDFRLEHVVYSYLPAEDFRRNYDSIFGLGLVLPGEKKIITG